MRDLVPAPSRHAARAAALVGLLALLAVALPERPASAEEWQPPLHHVFPMHRGRVGVEIQPMTPELRRFMQAPEDRGLLVARIEEGRPAAAAGLRVGDVLTEADGEPLVHPFDLVRRVARVPEGESLSLAVVREGKPLALEVKPEGEAQPWIDPDQWSDWLEHGMREGSRELRERLDAIEKRLQELERRLESPSAGPGQPT